MRKLGIKTHGLSKSLEYKSWSHMKERCYNIKCKKYPSYGARGIKICDRWRNSFENFLQDMGLKPGKEYTIERKDNNSDYSPNNCKWATPKEQARNKRGNKTITFNNKSQTIIEWSEELGIHKDVLYQRLNRLKWSVEKAFTVPILDNKTRHIYRYN